MDSDELRQMSIENAKLALSQSSNTNNRFGYKINPYDLDIKRRALLRKMTWWYREMEGDTLFEIDLGWGQKGKLSYSGRSWADYLQSHIGRGDYGEVSREVLNELRSIWMEWKDKDKNPSPKGNGF